MFTFETFESMATSSEYMTPPTFTAYWRIKTFVYFNLKSFKFTIVVYIIMNSTATKHF